MQIRLWKANEASTKKKSGKEKGKRRILVDISSSLFFSGGWSQSKQTEVQPKGRIREFGRAKADAWMEEERESCLKVTKVACSILQPGGPGSFLFFFYFYWSMDIQYYLSYRCTIQWFTIFKDYIPFIVIIKYWLHSPCCTIYPYS